MAQTHTIARFVRISAFGLAMVMAAASTFVLAQGTPAPGSARVTINGNSNVHAWTASSTAVKVTRAAGEGTAFEVSLRAASLSSPKEGLDKNMHKALKVEQHPEITFRVTRLEPATVAEGAHKATGLLTIAGVSREVTLDLTAQKAADTTLIVKGSVDLLMPDFGIAPPKALMGMVKADPKVTVLVEAALAAQ